MQKKLLSVISHTVFSRIYGRLTRIRRPLPLVRFIVRRFAGFYGVNMGDYRGELSDYPSLLDFFIRPLNRETRPLKKDPACVLSPADGTLVELQRIDRDEAAQVKGWTYKVSELIGKSEDWSRGWWLAVIYLSPADYHRYHYPLAGRLTSFHHLGNRLFPVNRIGVSTIDKLFIRNERVTASFSSGDREFHVTAVGATFVGSIKMAAHPAPFVPGRKVGMCRNVGQLEEMGRFELGSTLVLLLPRDMAEPLVQPTRAVRVGDPIFKLK